MTKFRGVEYEFSDGVKRIIPALSLRHVMQLQDRLAAFNGDPLAPGTVQTAVETVHAALSRNYPEMTLTEVEELLDLSDLAPVMVAVMGQAGLKERVPGEAVRATGSTG